MAASSDSQGLKIAVAVFIALSVILAVTSYFLYSNGAAAEARLTIANQKISSLNKAEQDIQAQYEDMRSKIGTRQTEADPAKEEINTHLKKVYERIDALVNSVNAAAQKAQQAGAQAQELEDLRGKIQQAVQSFRGQPATTYMASLDRLTELMENLSLLTTELGTNYLDVRRSLEAATSVTKQQVEVQTKAAESAHNELLEEQNKHKDERQSLLTKVESLTKNNDELTSEKANLLTQIDRIKGDYNREKETLTSVIRELRAKSEAGETILDHPDGHVIYVDYESREVQVNINKAMGARPQMVMSIFDAASPGIPTEKPKGTIELTKVGDRSSIARIIKTINPIEPIRTGDIVYSPAWSPNNPTRFALVGKIDVNRDGRDDREELKRMIVDSGGIVDFDLPPPYIGKETGKLSPRIDWYVTDDRIPIREVFLPRSEPLLKMESELAVRKGDVIKEARLDGIRPLPIERLLNFLGYDINTPVVGRTESVNADALRRLSERPVQTPVAAPKPPTGTPKEEAAGDDAEATPKKGESTKKADDADQ